MLHDIAIMQRQVVAGGDREKRQHSANKWLCRCLPRPNLAFHLPRSSAHLKKESSRLVKRQVESRTVRCTFRLPESSSFRLTVNQIECIYLIIPFGVKGKKGFFLKEKGRQKVGLLTEMNATRKAVFLAHLSVAGERKTFNKKRKDGWMQIFQRAFAEIERKKFKCGERCT